VKAKSPSVRLAVPPPSVRLATFDIPAIHETLEDATVKPALLVSYFYLEPFLKNQSRYNYRDWVMDSGAWSAHNSGAKIELKAYIEKCQQLIGSDKTLTEIFALDVIGDPKASIRNCEKMWEAGIQAIPCFHIGEPEAALFHIAKNYPKIAIGGVAYMKGERKMQFASQCFARVWPKKIHGFGFGSEAHVLALPWHSVDATNWEIGPCKFGRWQRFGNMSVRGSNQNLRSEVEFYLKLEKRAQVKWQSQMALLETTGPVFRLASQQASDAQIRRSGLAPAVRLAHSICPTAMRHLGAQIPRRKKK